MASTKDLKAKRPAVKNQKAGILFDTTISAAENRVEELAQKLVADGEATDLGEAQSMVLRDPGNHKLRTDYERKFQARA